MTEKPIREPIGKKLRFEVFKRDSFTCQYCGAKVAADWDELCGMASGAGEE